MLVIEYECIFQPVGPTAVREVNFYIPFRIFLNHYDLPNKRLESYDFRVPWRNTWMLFPFQVIHLLKYRHIVLRFKIHNQYPFARDNFSLYGHIYRPRFSRVLPIDPIGEERGQFTVPLETKI